MEEQKSIKLILFFLIILLATAILFYFSKPEKKILSEGEITIAAWNLQVFGTAKADNNTLIATYAEIIAKYDIVFIQEIRDESGAAFSKLCSMIPDYSCFTSSRAGRSSSKEEYGVIYKNDEVRLVSYTDFNPDPLDRWERPPLMVKIKTVNLNSSTISIYVLHSKPTDTVNEISNLESLIGNTSEPIVILGDLNADCSYFDPNSNSTLKSWNWIVKDNDDTTVGKTDCAYDRIILNPAASAFYLSYGIDKNITPDLSDHYLVWASLKLGR